LPLSGGRFTAFHLPKFRGEYTCKLGTSLFLLLSDSQNLANVLIFNKAKGKYKGKYTTKRDKKARPFFRFLLHATRDPLIFGLSGGLVFSPFFTRFCCGLLLLLFRVVVEAFAAPPARGGALPRLGVLSLSVIFRVCLLFVL